MRNRKSLKLVLLVILLLCIAMPAECFAYDGDAAALYAKKHAASGTYSVNYKAFSADCTNFVSQCVRAGGMSMEVPSNISYSEDKVFNTRTYWFMKKKNGHWRWSSTWSVVSKKQSNLSWGFYNYMTSERGVPSKEYAVDTTAKLNKFIKACNVGDVIQIREATDSVKHHSCIVTEKSYDKKKERYNMKICYHTTDTKDADFRSKKKAFSDDATWTLLSFTDL